MMTLQVKLWDFSGKYSIQNTSHERFCVYEHVRWILEVNEITSRPTRNLGGREKEREGGREIEREGRKDREREGGLTLILNQYSNFYINAPLKHPIH